MAASDIEAQLQTLDLKIGQLKREYEQYFLGTRPREPGPLRADVQKLVVALINTPFSNTGLRFKFSSLCSRYQALRRQWDETLRKIEAGTYERHRFKAGLRERPAPPSAPTPTGKGSPDLFRAYVDARLGCGQEVKALSRAALDRVVAEHRAKLQAKFGADARFRFEVSVEHGRARLKAVRG